MIDFMKTVPTCWEMFSVSYVRNYLSISELSVKLFHTNEAPPADTADF
jgi:hypothetical protein